MATSRGRLDLAVPVSMSVSDLVATVVNRLGAEAADEGAASGGWTLQRTAEAALDPAMSLAASGLTDGTVLHLRTRATELPTMQFDDVLDAVGEGVRSHTSRWNDTQTRIASAALGGVALTFGLAVALRSGPKWTAAALTCAVVAVILVGGTAYFARVARQRAVAGVCAALAIAYGACAGAMGVARDDEFDAFGAPELLAAAGVVVLLGVVGKVIVGGGTAGFLTAIGAGVLTAIGAGVAIATDLSATETASLIAGCALVISPALPMVAYRMSRLPLPAIPTGAADLRRDAGAIDNTNILGQVAGADGLLTGLIAGTALATAGASVILASGNGAAAILAGVLAAIWVLRARLFTGRWQRWASLAAGAVAAMAAVISQVDDLRPSLRVVAVAVPAVVVAFLLFVMASVLPGRRPSPPVTRIATILESVLVLAVIPLVLGIMGVYGRVKGLSD